MSLRNVTTALAAVLALSCGAPAAAPIHDRPHSREPRSRPDPLADPRPDEPAAGSAGPTSVALASLTPQPPSPVTHYGFDDVGRLHCRDTYVLAPAAVTSNGTPANGYFARADVVLVISPADDQVSAYAFATPEVARAHWPAGRHGQPTPIARPSAELLRRIVPGLPLARVAALGPAPPALSASACSDPRLAIEMPPSVRHRLVGPTVHRFESTVDSDGVRVLVSGRSAGEWNLWAERCKAWPPAESANVAAALDLEVICRGDVAWVAVQRTRPFDPGHACGSPVRCADTAGRMPCFPDAFAAASVPAPLGEEQTCDRRFFQRIRVDLTTGEASVVPSPQIETALGEM